MNRPRRDLFNDQRAAIWVHCNAQSKAWQAEQARIRDEANRKRSATQVGASKDEAKERACTSSSRTSRQPEREAKAAASGTNKGAIQRAEQMERDRPDLAEKVRKGELKPAARRKMQKDAVAERVQAQQAGKVAEVVEAREFRLV